MGLKKRDFTGTLRTALLEELRGGDRLSKRDLLARLRARPRLAASARTVGDALATLIDRGKVIMEGQRRAARFRRARPI